MERPTFNLTPKNHGNVPSGKRVGVLLVNLGTPDGTSYWPMRRYLSEFLSDRRVVELSPWLWQPILQGIVLTFRPKKSGHAYESIWDKTHDASPLRVISEAQVADLQKRLGKDVTVRLGMRYGQPAIKDGLSALMEEGCGRILVAPLYPQYSAATTGTVMDEVARWLLKQRWQPSLRSLPPYYDDAAYMKALAADVRRQMKSQPGKDAPVVVASFHGLPVKYCQKGDVYYCHSHKTARLLAEELGIAFCRTVEEAVATRKGGKPVLLLTFQSRFGKEEWLQPYTDKSLEALAAAGVNNVLVTCPGFAADCVETLEEIALAGGDSFKAAGGKTYEVVPCLNAGKDGMDMLETLVRRELQGWL